MTDGQTDGGTEGDYCNIHVAFFSKKKKKKKRGDDNIGDHILLLKSNLSGLNILCKGFM